MDHRSLTAFVEENKLVRKTDRVLLAVSGGIDSSVMTDLFRKAGYTFAILHCNFGLRGTESDEDEIFVRDIARKLHVDFFSERFSTSQFAKQHRISIQMAARELRYNWFEEIRTRYDFDLVATAHHKDDQVETFLINLIRGTGIAGLHGIPYKNGHIIRPLLFASRDEIEQYSLQNKIGYRNDTSNSELKYLRNRIRHELLPLIISLNSDFREGLTNSIARIAAFEQLGNRELDRWIEDKVIQEDQGYSVPIEHLNGLPSAELFAWKLLSPFHFNESQLRELLSNLHKEKRQIFTTPTHRLVKERKTLVISKIQQSGSRKEVRISTFRRSKSLNTPIRLKFSRIVISEDFVLNTMPDVATLDFDKLQFPLILRKWKSGDSFCPLGMKRRKKLSDFFIDQKFTLNQKEDVWLLCSGKEIAWIVGHRIDNRFRVTRATKEVLKILH